MRTIRTLDVNPALKTSRFEASLCPDYPGSLVQILLATHLCCWSSKRHHLQPARQTDRKTCFTEKVSGIVLALLATLGVVQGFWLAVFLRLPRLQVSGWPCPSSRRPRRRCCLSVSRTTVRIPPTFRFSLPSFCFSRKLTLEL